MQKERKTKKVEEERGKIQGEKYICHSAREAGYVNEVTRVAQSASRYIDVKLREK